MNILKYLKWGLVFFVFSILLPIGIAPSQGGHDIWASLIPTATKANAEKNYVLTVGPLDKKINRVVLEVANYFDAEPSYIITSIQDPSGWSHTTDLTNGKIDRIVWKVNTQLRPGSVVEFPFSAKSPSIDGSYQWKVQGQDFSGFSREIIITTVVDSVEPELIVSHSPQNPTSQDSITLIGEATDNRNELRDITLFWSTDSINFNLFNCLSTYCSTNIGSFSPLTTIYYYGEAFDLAENFDRDPASGFKTIFIPNFPPVLGPIADIVVNEGELVYIVANANDFDGQNLIYSINNPRFSQNNNIFEWQTNFDDSGNYVVTVSVTDGIDFDSQQINVQVLNVCTDNDNDDVYVEGGICDLIDCNDNDQNINPSASEVCDGIDNNCDGTIDEGFADYDSDGKSDCVDDDICEPNWVESIGQCDANDEQIGTFTDTMDCFAYTNDPSDNNPPPNNIYSCNFCDPEYSMTVSSCQLDDLIYTDYEYTNTCCQETGLASDCIMPDDFTTSCDFCTPEWTEQINGCNSNDEQIGTFNDLNDCFSQTGLDSDNQKPADNIYTCDFCQPDWQENIGQCNTNDEQIGTFLDTNDCFAQTGLDSDNNKPSDNIYQCDYCTPQWQETIGQCNTNNEQIGTFSDLNNCYAQTGLDSDNQKPNDNTYQCDFCTPNWVETLGQCQPNDQRIGTFSDTNNCYAQTNLDSDNNKPADNVYGCDFCTPDFVCDSFTACQSDDLMYCDSVNDLNDCFATTGLVSDNYNGDFSEFVPVQCSYCNTFLSNNDADNDNYPSTLDASCNFELDCKDDDETINPGADETCDGIDNNCDGNIDEGFLDTDSDGIADCVDTDDDDDDFNDTDDCSPNDPNINPNAPEVCDGVDNNCNGLIDENFPDSDSDSVADCVDDDDDDDTYDDNDDCAPNDPLINPGAPEVCDGIDNNCNLQIDENFPDTDGDNVADCVDLDDDDDGYTDDNDCDDSNPAINPGAAEVCDGIDNNCNGLIDENFPDFDNDNSADCVDPDDDNDGVDDLNDCDDDNANIFPGNAETCNGIDDNCNSLIDENFPDYDQDGMADCVDNDVCEPNWIETQSACNTNDQIIGTYADENDCFAYTQDPSDNNKPADNYYPCDFCTPNWIETVSECNQNDEMIGTFSDANNCFAQTGLDSDNDKPADKSYGCDYELLHNPTLQVNGDLEIIETEMVSLQLTGADPQNGALVYSTNDQRFSDNGNGLFTWQTGYDDAGVYQVTFTVTDDEGFIDTEIVTLTVLNLNRAPVIELLIPNGNEQLNGQESISWQASDADGELLTITIEISSDGSTWQTIFQSTNNDSSESFDTTQFIDGNYLIRVTAFDGTASVSDVSDDYFTIDNTAPIINEDLIILDENDPGTNDTTVGDENATEPDQTIEIYCDGVLIANFTANADGSFDLTSIGDNNCTNITIVVTDEAGNQDSITLMNDIQAPTISTADPVNGIVNEPVNFDASGSSDNMDNSLSYLWDLGNNTTYSTPTFTFIFTEAGTYQVTLTVTDDAGNSDQQIITVNIANPPQPQSSGGGGGGGGSRRYITEEIPVSNSPSPDQYCGDGRCQGLFESSLSCPEDCPRKFVPIATYCGDGICQEEKEDYNSCSNDCEAPEPEPVVQEEVPVIPTVMPPKKPLDWRWILLIILAVAAVIYGINDRANMKRRYRGFERYSRNRINVMKRSFGNIMRANSKNLSLFFKSINHKFSMAKKNVFGFLFD